MWVTTTTLAKIEGVTTQSIRRNIEAGYYDRVKRTHSGHYRIFIQQEQCIAYARVSSKKQQGSIDNQAEKLLAQYPDAELITDIASAFNFKRKGLIALLGRAMQGNPLHVVVTTQDRLARSGFDLIRHVIELHGGKVTVLDDADTPQTTFDTNELIGFITSFCNSHYGKRSAQRRKDRRHKKDTNIPAK